MRVFVFLTFAVVGVFAIPAPSRNKETVEARVLMSDLEDVLRRMLAEEAAGENTGGPDRRAFSHRVGKINDWQHGSLANPPGNPNAGISAGKRGFEGYRAVELIEETGSSEEEEDKEGPSQESVGDEDESDSDSSEENKSPEEAEVDAAGPEDDAAGPEDDDAGANGLPLIGDPVANPEADVVQSTPAEGVAPTPTDAPEVSRKVRIDLVAREIAKLLAAEEEREMRQARELAKDAKNKRDKAEEVARTLGKKSAQLDTAIRATESLTRIEMLDLVTVLKQRYEGVPV